MNKNYLDMTSIQIENLSDDELKNIYMSIRSQIILNKKTKNDTKDLEILFCYVSRELEVRI
jgi:hypothetical protein|tara:strand:- start:685 stop:867 length:183 start_codon:yes stop_codon:yes gene_type:complete